MLQRWRFLRCLGDPRHLSSRWIPFTTLPRRNFSPNSKELVVDGHNRNVSVGVRDSGSPCRRPRRLPRPSCRSRWGRLYGSGCSAPLTSVVLQPRRFCDARAVLSVAVTDQPSHFVVASRAQSSSVTWSRSSSARSSSPPAPSLLSFALVHWKLFPSPSGLALPGTTTIGPTNLCVFLRPAFVPQRVGKNKHADAPQGHRGRPENFGSVCAVRALLSHRSVVKSTRSMTNK